MMKRILLATALSLAALPAMAGTFCASVQKSTDPAPLQHCVTTADSNIDQFAAWASSTFYPKGYQTGTDASGNPVYATPTSQQVVDAVGAAIWTGELANVNSYLKAQAAASAAASAPQVQ